MLSATAKRQRILAHFVVGDDQTAGGSFGIKIQCLGGSVVIGDSLCSVAGSLTAKAFRSRRLMRAPIGLYRAGLGFLFGTRLVMLEHVGRSSGAARFVVLEVVSRPSTNTVIVASAFGRRAQWFQNLVADPQCHASIGFRRRVAAQARVLGSDAADRFLDEYKTEHPALWKQLNSIMTSLHDGDSEFELPLVELNLSR